MIDPHARNVRVGVMLANLTDAASCTAFDGMDAKRDKGLGDILDQANRRFGLQSVGIGYAGIKGRGRAHQETGAKWSIKRQKLSSGGTNMVGRTHSSRSTIEEGIMTPSKSDADNPPVRWNRIGAWWKRWCPVLITALVFLILIWCRCA